MADSTAKTWLIDNNYLKDHEGHSGTWQKKSLPVDAEKIEFLSAQICQDISCTISTCRFNEPYQSHIHYDQPTTLLVFGIEGTSRFTFAAKGLTCVVRPGDVWLFSSNDDALQRNTPPHVLAKMIVIKYASRRLQRALNDTDDIRFDFEPGSMMRLGFQQSPEQWIEALVQNKLLSISDRLLAEAKALELFARWVAPVDKITKKESSSLQVVLDLLTHNLANPPSLEYLAQQVGMSHTRLNRQFKKEFGVTVFTWLRNHRLERAKRYLDDQHQAITNIALNCGFSSASHFTQTFKDQFGMTPSEYRQNR